MRDQKSSSSELVYCISIKVERPAWKHSQYSSRSPSSQRVNIINVCFGVIRRSFLKKVGLSLQRDHVHKVEGVTGIVHLGVSERFQQVISNELDVLTHEPGVHSYQSHR